MAPSEPPSPYVGRAGLKLRHALDEFKIDVTGRSCADFGCNIGGFSDCLLRAGALRVYALDTGYGMLDWKLRNDPRVVVMERTNALHAAPPRIEPGSPGVSLVCVDMGWTPQRACIPAALRWLDPGEGGAIITLIKPHYEASAGGESKALHGGILQEHDAERIARGVADSLALLGARVEAMTRSPLVGGAGKKGNKGRGNTEFLALVRPAGAAPGPLESS